MANDIIKEGLLGVCKKGGRVESRYFLLYKDRLEYFKSQEETRSGADPRGRIGLQSIHQCDELDDSSGFKLVLGEGKGLEVKVYNGQEELDAWLDALASVWGDDLTDDNATNDKKMSESTKRESSPSITRKHVSEVVPPASATQRVPKNDDLQQQRLDQAVLHIRSKLKAIACDKGGSWSKLFEKHDGGKSGEIGYSEFRSLIRRDAELADSVLTDEDLRVIFKTVAGHHGALNFSAFIRWAHPDGADDELARLKLNGTPSKIAGASTGSENMSPAALVSPPDVAAEVFAGFLVMLRKGKSDRRYFAIQKDRLAYYMDEAAMKIAIETNQQPRGMLMLSEISHVEETDAGFTIFMKEGSRSLQLETDTDEDTAGWLRGLDATLKVIGMDSAITPRSRETLSFRFEKLDFKAIDQNAFREELLVQFRALGMAEGVVSRMRIAFRPGSVIADVTGVCSAVQELRKKASEKTILVMGSAPVLMDAGKVAESERADSPKLQSVVKSESDQIPKLRSVSWKKAGEGEVNELVQEGAVDVLKKGVPERRYLVLFTDRFEFFESVKDYRGGSEPRSRVSYLDVENLEFLADGFNIHHPKRLFQLRTGSEPDSVQKWFLALKKVFDFEIDGIGVPSDMPTEKLISTTPSVTQGITVEGPKASPKAANEIVQRQMSPDESTKKKRKEQSGKSDGGTSTDASTVSSPSPLVQVPSISIVPPEQPPTKEEPPQPHEPILYQGILSMLKKGQPERRHCVLYLDRLEIYTNSTDMKNGIKPRGRIAIADIREIDVLDMGFSIKLPDRSLNLHATHKTEFGKWQAALDKACEQRAQQEVAEGKKEATEGKKEATEGKKEVTQGKKEVTQGSANEKDLQSEASKSKLVSLHEGQAMIEIRGASSASSSSRYVVLVSEGFRMYTDKKARDEDADPQAVISKASVKNLDVLDTGFEIQAAEQSCIVRPLLSELDSWLLSLGSLFEDSHEANGSVLEQPDRVMQDGDEDGDEEDQERKPKRLPRPADREEPLQSKSQLQQVPHSARGGDSPRLVWHSMLEVQEGGHGVWKYFALYGDVLVSYDTASDMANGKTPEGRIPLDQVHDVKVGSMGFVLQFSQFNLAFRVSNEPGSLDAWISALHQVLVFSVSEQDPHFRQQLLHQGTLELVEEQRAKLQHFCLYADHLECFGSTADALNGRRCQKKFALADVNAFKVTEQGFIIRLSTKDIELRVVCREDLEVWVAAFRSAFADQSRRQASSTIPEESPAELPSTPGFGISPSNSWKDSLGSSAPSQGFKMAKVLKLLFPAAPWPTPNHFEAELRKNLQAIGAPRGTQQHSLGGVSFKDGCVTAEITGNNGALEELRRTLSLPNAQFSVCGYRIGDVSIGTTKVLADPTKSQKGQALVYQGNLGIQHGGCLSQKYFMLYQDRLDYFDSKEDALSGVRPRGRIAIGEVSSYEAYGSGFILKLLGRSVGLHVSADGRDQWTKYLLEVLKNSKVEEKSKPGKTPPRQQGAWGAGRTSVPKAKARPRSTTPRKSPQPPRGISGSPNDDTIVSSSQSLNGSGGLMKSRGSPGNLLSAALSHTSKSENAPGGWVSNYGDEHKDVRKGDGGLWLSRDVSGKVIERDPHVAVWTRNGSDAVLADKVTGDRSASGALASKLAAPRLTEASHKVNQSLTPRRASSTLGHSRSSPEITGKVNEAGRIMKSAENSLHHHVPDKVTGGRDGSGWLHRGREKSLTGDKAAGLRCADIRGIP